MYVLCVCEFIKGAIRLSFSLSVDCQGMQLVLSEPHGKYVIWNMAGEVRGSHSELEFDEKEPLEPLFPIGIDDFRNNPETYSV